MCPTVPRRAYHTDSFNAALIDWSMIHIMFEGAVSDHHQHNFVRCLWTDTETGRPLELSCDFRRALVTLEMLVVMIRKSKWSTHHDRARYRSIAL